MRWSAGVAALATLPAFAGCAPPEPDPIAGQWLVDFGTSKGVLGMKRGHVHAVCYPGSPSIGTYSLTGDELTLLIDFKGSGRAQDFSGRIVPETEQAHGPFRLHLGSAFDHRTLPFAPYSGECGEFAEAK
jgi:hypothetical protein